MAAAVGFLAGDAAASAGAFRLVWTDEMDVGYAFGLRGDASQVWAVE